ncbi:MAG: peptide deformylase [Acidobacteria bacterium]|nr:peptide deformylase [Acidobacteriota bacterium]
MAIRPILKFGEPVLEKKAEEVKDINGELMRLIEDMIETMYAEPGVGLAAPQVGVSQRVMVVDLSIGKDPNALIKLINPQIAESEGEVEEEEGCLSFPEVSFLIKRPKRVLIKGVNPETGKEEEIEGEDLLARAFCHEVDHLNGTLIIDHIGPIKRRLWLKRIKKRMKAGEW